MFSINTRDSRPIYEQLTEHFRKLIVTGAIRENEKLPSVRELASSAAINPNTIQRAYRELEIQGYVYTVAGKGCFACAGTDVDTRRTGELLTNFERICSELLFLGVTKDELINTINNISANT